MFSPLNFNQKNKFMKKGSEYLFKYIKSGQDKRNYLIEPMCCMIRLGILKYMDIGTKICIYDNSITYYEPNIIQGMMRTWNGDNREDLHNLYNPIIVALRWFDTRNEFYRNFFIRARDGIIKLKKVYENNSIIHHTLNHYIRTINDSLNMGLHNKSDFEETYEKFLNEVTDCNPEPEQMLTEFNNRSSCCEMTNSMSDKSSDSDDNPLSKSTIKNDHINFIEVFKDLWSETELQIINSTFEQLYNIDNCEIKDNINNKLNKKDIINTYINSINLIVKQKEKHVKEIIISTTTRY
jgi:hypothetical protein